MEELRSLGLAWAFLKSSQGAFGSFKDSSLVSKKVTNLQDGQSRVLNEIFARHPRVHYLRISIVGPNFHVLFP